MLRHVNVVYFSPTGKTRETALCLAREMAESVHEVDLAAREAFTPVFKDDDVVLFAAPVFAGRIPAHIAAKITECQANRAQAVAVVVYGNRHYDDALLELSDTLAGSGFRLTAAAALVAEHSMLREVAAGRPDAQDRRELKDFAEKIIAKVERGEVGEVKAPGNRPYAERRQLPIVPLVAENCNGCGICATQCPVGAIDSAKPQETILSKCILCMRCIHRCPQNARSLPEQALQMLSQKLAQAKILRRGNELYL